MMSATEIAKESLQAWLLRGTFVWRLPSAAGCALTFDDGPHETYTPAILDLLRHHHVKATFFVVGDAVMRSPELLLRIASEGHAIGSHTFSHREITNLNAVELEEDLARTRKVISELTGINTNLVRPPRGRVDIPSLLRMRRLKYKLIHWSRTYSDYLHDGTAPLVERIRSRGLDSGDIALFHDDNLYTLEALEVMLPQWCSRGLKFTVIG